MLAYLAALGVSALAVPVALRRLDHWPWRRGDLPFAAALLVGSLGAGLALVALVLG